MAQFFPKSLMGIISEQNISRVNISFSGLFNWAQWSFWTSCSSSDMFT